MSDYAPIILFVYARCDHTKKTIEALKKNTLASKSDLFIFSDQYKNERDVNNVSEVRNYIRHVEGFKTVTVIEREYNLGLAENIRLGVSEIIEKYGRVIVLEDDIVTSNGFLTFMNKSLDIFKQNHKVWHISGWNYPIDATGLKSMFLWRGMNCWGWATWSDRWSHYNKNPQLLLSSWGRDKIKQFNLDGFFPFWNQVIANEKGKINTWAIFWYATIFENNGLCINPTTTLVKNIGLDGTGENCSSMSSFDKFDKRNECDVIFFEGYTENEIATNRIKEYCSSSRLSLVKKIKNKIIKKIKKM
ncbi:hypothetical protein ACSTJW_07745 [Vibrio parahaemolyticus]